MPRIAVIAGDGIGPEVMAEGKRLVRALEQAAGLGIDLTEFDYGADRYLRDGTTMPDWQIEEFKQSYDAILFGAVGDPRVPDNAHIGAILLGLRFKLDLYQNIRPCRLYADDLCPLKGKTRADVDFVVFRENTEGLYAGVGGSFKKGTPDEIAIAEDLNSRKGVERIVRAALAWAAANGKTRVCMSDKANAVKAPGDLWQRVWREVGAEYPQLHRRHQYIDALCMDLVRRPEAYQVIVTNNMFGDLVTDLGAALAGGLGLAASANVGAARPGLFEPVHGSAPDIAGQGKANPMAMALTVGLMLEHLGWPDLRALVEKAVEECLRDGRRTPDVGGTDSTQAVGAALAERTLLLARGSSAIATRGA